VTAIDGSRITLALATTPQGGGQGGQAPSMPSDGAQPSGEAPEMPSGGRAGSRVTAAGKRLPCLQTECSPRARPRKCLRAGRASSRTAA
jgi:hypothetical protein